MAQYVVEVEGDEADARAVARQLVAGGADGVWITASGADPPDYRIRYIAAREIDLTPGE